MYKENLAQNELTNDFYKNKEFSTKGLNKLSEELNKFQIDAGFTDSNITQRLMLIHSEISEAFEAFRRDTYFSKNSNNMGIYDLQDLTNTHTHRCSIEHWKSLFESNVKDTFEDEIADSIIRLLALASENNIDIENHIDMKMKYNIMRGFKFGGKKF